METTTSVDSDSTPAAATPETEEPRRGTDFRGGWRIVASKELADHLLSIRFGILLVLIALTGLAVVNSVASAIRTAAESLSEASSVFLLLYTVSADRIPWSFVDLMGFLAPLLGLAFGFTAINSERANRTLPRLVSQPIHRDDVITGKFAAGLALIALAVATLMALLSGGDIARLVTFALVIVLYVGVWLALAILLSVLTRSAVTAVLAGMGLWLVLTLFAPLISGIVADAVSPADETATFEEQLSNAQAELWVRRLSPQGVYDEASSVLLNPQARSVGILSTTQLDQALADPLAFDQSLLLIWPQITALVALTVALFSAAFVQFLQQEIRA
jgi:ABC-2 type transport system permease protein